MGKTLVAKAAATSDSDFWMPMEGGQVGKFEIAGDRLLKELDGEHLCGIIGYSDDFEIISKQWGPQQKIKLLFRILDGEFKGQEFALMFGYALGPKAKLNEIITAARKAPITAGEEFDFDSLFGLKVYVFVTTELNDKGYQNIYYGGSREVKAKSATATPAPAPALAAVGAASAYDPFAEDN